MVEIRLISMPSISTGLYFTASSRARFSFVALSAKSWIRISPFSTRWPFFLRISMPAPLSLGAPQALAMATIALLEMECT